MIDRIAPGARAARGPRGLLLLLAAAICCAASLPDVIAPPRPDPEPALPGAFDPFAPPLVAGLGPEAGAPTAGEWTRTADRGNALVVAGQALSAFAGAEVGKDTAFLCFGQNPGGSRLGSAQIVRLDGRNAAIQLDAALPTPAMYLVWPRNANGYGAPMVVNRAEAWWVGPDTVAPGEATALYGRHLSSAISGSAAGTAWVYIKPLGTAAGRWLTPTAANPYKVDVVIPADLGLGTYELWAHNGHGGHWGWSAPTRLTITAGETWGRGTLNLKTGFGAVGDGVHDDAPALQNAVIAAGNAPGSTIYVPTGTYKLGSRSDLPPHTRIRGDGAGLSILRAESADWANSTRRSMLFYAGPADHSALVGLTLDAGQATHCDLLNSGSARPGFLTIADCDLLATVAPNNTVFLAGTDHVILRNLTINGSGLALVDCRQVFVDQCRINGMNNVPLINASGACSEMSYTRNLGQDYDNAIGRAYDPATSSYAGDPTFQGWCQGLFIKGLNGVGARHGTYVGDNTTLNMGVRLTNPDGSPNLDNNWGEQISFEWNHGKFAGRPLAGSAGGLSFAAGALNGVPTASALVAVVIDGTGQGQWRDVGTLDPASGALALAAGQTWNVVPDATSTVALGWYVLNVAGYRNSFTGKPDRVEGSRGHGIWGIIPYWGVMNLMYDSNTLVNNDKALYVFSHSPSFADVSLIQPEFFHVYLNNSMVDCRTDIHVGIAADPAGSPAIPAGDFGLVFRSNHGRATRTITRTSGINMNLQDCKGPQVDMLLFEGNVFSETPTGVGLSFDVDDSAGNLVFLGNAFSRDSAPATWPVMIDHSRGQARIVLRGNSFTGYTIPEYGPPIGGVLEAPSRVADLVASGAAVSGALPVWNAGLAAALPWSATSDAAWLTLGSTAGTVADQVSAGSCTYTCDPAGLAAGLHVGSIALASGAQLRKTTVRFTVAPASGQPVIISQPQSRSVYSPQRATFSVVAAGTTALSYQWQRDGVAIAGATDASYLTPATSIADDGSAYRVVVTGSDQVVSTAAVLTVTDQPPPVVAPSVASGGGGGCGGGLGGMLLGFTLLWGWRPRRRS